MLKFTSGLIAIAALTACSGQAAAPEPDADGIIVSSTGYELIPVADGLEFPWGLAELPDGDLLVTEREGRLRMIDDGALVAAPISGLPDDILVDGQGGLLGILLDTEFPANRRLYLSYSKDMGDSNATAVISAELSEDATSLSNVTEIFLGQPRESAYHYGSRLGFLPDGTLLITTGEGGSYRDEAQNLESLHGKIARVNTDGSLPSDNPFADGGGHPAIWSYGHRNVQGMIFDTSRDLVIAHEHGPKGGDEINIVQPKNNYGWPEITYGINYDGTIITDQTEAPGMEQPAHKWVPSIAPSGMALVQTAGFEDWHGDLLIGAMNGPAGQKLVRVEMDQAGTVTATEDILTDLQIPYRDVISTPTAIYVATANLDGAVYRLNVAE